MSWTAIVPIKPPGMRKLRLSEHLSLESRDRLAEVMLCHVYHELSHVEQVSRVVLLAREPIPCWDGEWTRDRGRGINTELNEAARLAGGRVLVIHADLPLVTAEEIGSLLDAAQDGIAIAPDRHGAGTNAIACAGAVLIFYQFGAESLGRHVAAAGQGGRVFESAGLAADIDTASDIAFALAAGPPDAQIEQELRRAADDIAQHGHAPQRAVNG